MMMSRRPCPARHGAAQLSRAGAPTLAVACSTPCMLPSPPSLSSSPPSPRLLSLLCRGPPAARQPPSLPLTRCVAIQLRQQAHAHAAPLIIWPPPLPLSATATCMPAPACMFSRHRPPANTLACRGADGLPVRPCCRRMAAWHHKTYQNPNTCAACLCRCCFRCIDRFRPPAAISRTLRPHAKHASMVAAVGCKLLAGASVSSLNPRALVTAVPQWRAHAGPAARTPTPLAALSQLAPVSCRSHAYLIAARTCRSRGFQPSSMRSCEFAWTSFSELARSTTPRCAVPSHQVTLPTRITQSSFFGSARNLAAPAAWRSVSWDGRRQSYPTALSPITYTSPWCSSRRHVDPTGLL